MTNNSIIELEGLYKKFGSHFAVKDLSFEVGKGDLFGFLGPNGAGKSTTLYILLGLVFPTKGRALIFGHPPSNLEHARSRLGAMIETPSFYPQLTAEKNLEQSARLLGPEAMQTISHVLEKTGLSHAARIKVQKFSTGMKQRLGIARALLGSPELLILDEPTNGLDPEGTVITWKLLEEFTGKQGGTVLVSSHLLPEIEEHCNRVCVIRDGESVACGEVAHLLQFHNRPIEISCEDEESANRLRGLALKESWIEEPRQKGSDSRRLRLVCPGRSPAQIHQFLVENHIRLEQFTPLRNTLRDFFLSLTKKDNLFKDDAQ